MPDENLPPELKEKLREAERKINQEEESRFNPKRGAGTALLCAAAFFAFGITIGRASLGNSIGFAIVGAVVGFCVGACRRPGTPQR